MHQILLFSKGFQGYALICAFDGSSALGASGFVGGYGGAVGGVTQLWTNAEQSQDVKMLVDEVWQIVQQEYVDESFNQVDWLAVGH